MCMYRLPPQLLQHGYLIQDKMKPELMATHLELVCMAMVTAPDSIGLQAACARQLAGEGMCVKARCTEVCRRQQWQTQEARACRS